jgi:hypothetical protein
MSPEVVSLPTADERKRMEAAGRQVMEQPYGEKVRLVPAVHLARVVFVPGWDWADIAALVVYAGNMLSMWLLSAVLPA